MKRIKMELSKLMLLLFLFGLARSDSGVGDSCNHNKLNKKGLCKLLRDCEPAKEDIKQNRLPQTCGFSPKDNHPIVCCMDDRADGIKPVLQSRTNVSADKCIEYTGTLPRLDSFVPNIVKGINATIGEFPHMAALGYDGDNEIKWLCGGSLISENYVLTAAHCLSSATGSVKYVRLGTIDLKDNPTENVYNVLFSIAHPEFKPPAKYHDIALLELEESVRFNNFIRPACLYASTDLTRYETKSLRVSGYGATEFGGNPSSLLQYVVLDLYSKDECSKYYTISKRLLPDGITDDNMLCAGKRNDIQDACQGDSGGPLQVKIFKETLFHIVGVTSSGKGCGSKDVPGLYTRVASYVKWIEDIVWVD